MNVKDHATVPKTHGCIGMSGGIVADLGEGIKSFLCSLCLKGRHIEECDKHFVIHSDGLI